MLSRIAVLLAVVTALTIAPTAAQAATLRAPSGLAPAANAPVQTVPPFTWDAVPGAQAYDFQLAADRGFGSIVDKGHIRTKNTAATVVSAVADGTYFWRVRAIGAKDKAGRWTSPRPVVKAWTSTPTLLGPSDPLAIKWPDAPAVLRWTPAQHASRYELIVATDPSFANPVVGSIKRPLETQGTVYAINQPLNSGRYYWAVTPIDAGNFRGRQSSIGSFDWNWSTSMVVSELSVKDIDGRDGVFHPFFTWRPVPGAARYEVEVNPTTESTPGSRVFAGVAFGTRYSPTQHLPNNTYDWRVRAIDNAGNAGAWSAGPLFKKEFNDRTATIKNVRITDHSNRDLGDVPVTEEPLVTWDRVDGATRYEMQFTKHTPGAGGSDGYCDWAQHFGNVLGGRPVITPVNAWAAGADARPKAVAPGSYFWDDARHFQNPFVTRQEPGTKQAYCMRILALDSADNISEWTYVNAGRPGDRSADSTNPNRAAFTYSRPSAPPAQECPPAAPVNYLYPAPGSTRGETPYFQWTPVAGARGYWLVVARDAEFTNVVHVGFVNKTVYAPRELWTDETTLTAYHWKVIPAGGADGSCAASPNTSSAMFLKRSEAPTIRDTDDSLGDGEAAGVQPSFQWTPVPAAHEYRLQVSSDPQFGKIIDDVTTASTAYASGKAYGADPTLYWRVRATMLVDGRKFGLNWSETHRFGRALETPTPSAENAAGGEMIPVLAWHPVQGAVSYDMSVLQSDGTARNFSNLRSTQFTPTLWWGTGVWTWRVRANFAGAAHSGYFPPQSFVRRINAPQQARVSVSRSRMLFTWQPDPAAHRYRIQLSTTDSFTRIADEQVTELASWAPKLDKPWYKLGGPLWWRIAVVDGGNNVGAYTTGRVAIPKQMAVVATGALKRGRKGSVVVTVRDASNRPVSAAALRSSGAGSKAAKARTGSKGTGTLRIRATKRGTVKIRVIKRGWLDGTVSVKVR